MLPPIQSQLIAGQDHTTDLGQKPIPCKADVFCIDICWMKSDPDLSLIADAALVYLTKIGCPTSIGGLPAPILDIMLVQEKRFWLVSGLVCCRWNGLTSADLMLFSLVKMVL